MNLKILKEKKRQQITLFFPAENPASLLCAPRGSGCHSSYSGLIKLRGDNRNKTLERTVIIFTQIYDYEYISYKYMLIIQTKAIK